MSRPSVRRSKNWPRATTSAVDAYLRLMELAEAKQDWEAVAKNADRMLAVNPLVAAPHRYLAQAAEKLGQRDEAIRAYQRCCSSTRPTSPRRTSAWRSCCATTQKRDAARRHVLMALEEAPRFLDAHQLLLELDADQRRRRFVRPMTIRRSNELTHENDDRSIARSRIVVALRSRRRRRWLNIATAGDDPDDRAGVPMWENDPEFKNDVFTFVRVQYDSYGGRGGVVGGGGWGGGGGWAHRLSRQRLQLLLPPAAAHVAQGESRTRSSCG